MKTTVWMFAALALVTTLSTSVQAQSRITVKVPFTFVILDKTFPAGQYSVSSDRDKLTVQDSNGKAIFIGMTNPVSGRRVATTGQIVFHCYESRCFLSEFWTPEREDGNQLLYSRYEREVAKHEERTEFALLGESHGRQ